MKTIRIGALALLILSAAAIAGIGKPETAGGAESDQRHGITVTGTGRVETVPNEAMFSLGVSTDGATAREALAANSAAMRRVLSALDNAGVGAKDVKTETVSIGPDYDGGDNPSGYAARNSVSVRVRDLAKVGAVLDAASRAGANEVNGPMLTRSNREKFEAKALEGAFDDARKRATALADAAGVNLGGVTAIVEGTIPDPQPWLMDRAAVAKDPSAPISPGTEEIRATVTVTFAIE
jgi:uncharacterized protein YggE